jgi:thiopeptide-type bacteriocin biosynthesis protein
VDAQKLFHTTLCSTSEATLDKTLERRITHGVCLLAKMARQSSLANDDLHHFCQQFEIRYGEEPQPLLAVLDESLGIGFNEGSGIDQSAAPLLQTWTLSPSINQKSRGSRSSLWHSQDNELLSLLTRALQNQADEIELSSEDISALLIDENPPLPPGLIAIVILAKTHHFSSEYQDQHRIFLRRCVGPTCAKLLGRFGHGDEALTQYLKKALRQEEAHDPDAIHAEIVHLPQGRAGNVIARPILRDYEIAVGDACGVSPEHRIFLTDLWVSVRKGRVYLTSARLGRRVIPHLSCAHAHDRSAFSAYRFLACVSTQNYLQDFSFSWGALSCAPFLPRITYKDLVLSLARWNFKGQDLKKIDSVRDAGARFAAWQLWRAQHRLPRYVSLEENDNALPLDLDNVLSLETLMRQARRSTHFTLCETFPHPKDWVAVGPQGHHAHEILMPFVCVEHQKFEKSQVPRIHKIEEVASTSTWLYLKIYCGEISQDRILSDIILPLLVRLQSQAMLDRWFFIRYTDPEPHLRLRLKGHDSSHVWQILAPQAFGALEQACTTGLIRHVSTDHYEPEFLRYGGPQGLACCEKIFEADSETVCTLLENFRTDQEARWQLTMRSMTTLLDDFGLNLTQKIALLRQCREHQTRQIYPLKDTNTSNDFQHQLGITHRRLGTKACALLRDLPPDAKLDFGFQAFQRRSQHIAPLVSVLKALQPKAPTQAPSLLSIPLNDIIASLLHMGANRMLSQHANLQEMILYDLTARAYEKNRHTAYL